MRMNEHRRPVAFVLAGAVLVVSLLLPRLFFAWQENAGLPVREIPRMESVPLAKVLYLRRMQNQNDYDLYLWEGGVTEETREELSMQMRDAWYDWMLEGWNVDSEQIWREVNERMPTRLLNGTVYWNATLKDSRLCTAVYEPCLEKIVFISVPTEQPAGDLNKMAGRWKRYLKADELDDWRPVTLRAVQGEMIAEYSESGQLLLCVALDRKSVLTMEASSVEPEQLQDMLTET